MQISARSNLSICLMLISLTLISCYENKEGCLHLDATNFDPTADVACEDDCCNFPTARIGVSHIVDTTVGLVLGDTFDYHNNIQFAIDQAQFYTSGFSFVNETQMARTTDQLKYSDASQNEQSIEDDIVLIRATQYQYDIGQFRSWGEYTKLDFGLGLPQELETATSLVLPTDHPIAVAGDSLKVNDQYVHAWLVLRQIDHHMEGASDTIIVTSPDQSYSLDITAENLRGQNIQATFQINYKMLINGVDFNSQTKTEISNIVAENLKTAFRSNS